MKRHLVRLVQKYLANPLARMAVRLGVVRGLVLLETIGRKSGRVYVTPVGAQRHGFDLWIVAEHGDAAGYVRNIKANPHVRVLVDRRWHAGTARLVTDDDPRERLARMDSRLNARMAQVLGTSLLSIRVQLDSVEGAKR